MVEKFDQIGHHRVRLGSKTDEPNQAETAKRQERYCIVSASPSAAGPIKVLYFIGSLSTGGSELHLANLLLTLDRSLVDPVLMVVVEKGNRADLIRQAGITVHNIDLRGGAKGILESIPRIRNILRKEAPDVVHTYGYNSQLYAALAVPLGSKVKIVGSRRGNQPKRSHHWIFRGTNPRMAWVLCVSEATRRFSERTEGLAAKKSSVIPNGLDLTRFPPRKPAPGPLRTIGTLGRLRAVKGSDLLLEAFRSLQGPDRELRMGGPADRAWGENLVKAHKADPGVKFLGDVDATQFLPELDLFVLPSRSEGMSNALLEAMASGLPIVATDVGGNSEVLEGGRCGVLVAPNAGAIEAGIRTLLNDPELAAEYARRARARAEAEYAHHIMVQRYHQFYDQLLSGTLSNVPPELKTISPGA